MEFKIWGRLDESGRIQSIQSNCSGLNHDIGSLQHRCGDSLVTLNEKKKLLYQLDSKTDEMSLLILQMSEMSKRIELQQKLLCEYENKFRRQQEELEQLRRENFSLKHKAAVDSISNQGPCTPELTKSRLPFTTFEMTCNLRCKPFKHQSCPVMSTSSFEEADEFRSSGSDSTRSECTSTESSSSAPYTSLDNVDGYNTGNAELFEGNTGSNILEPTDSNDKVSFDVNDECNKTDESKLQSCDGYVLAPSDTKMVDQTADIRNFNERQPCPPAPHSNINSASPFTSIETDKDGYLILDKFQVKQIAHEEIHGTWLSVNLKIQQSQYGTDSDVVDGHIPQSSTDNDKNVCSAVSRTSEGYLDPGISQKRHHRSHGYVEIDESKLDPAFPFKRHSEPSDVYLPAKEERSRERSSSADSSKDDVCNSCIKTMKTTMEWAKAKKGLLKESHEITVERVESVLRDTVQEIYTALKHYESEKSHRSNKPVVEKAAAIQRKLKRSKVVDIVSDDFLRKCVMVCSNKPS